jgi:hypothetical protein
MIPSVRCRPRSALATALAALLAVLIVQGARAGDSQPDMAGMPGMSGSSGQSSSEIVLFLSAEAHDLTEPASSGELNEDAPGIGDLLIAINRNRFRFLSEFQLSNVEHDLERSQVGFELIPDTVIWLGRFHQPSSAWNTEHHHGRYLQTSVTRPSIEVWEDEEGLIPQHITGVLIESRRPIGAHAGLLLSAGGGFGVNIDSEGLEPVDLLHPNFAHRRLAVNGRIAFLPSYVGTSSFGVLFAHNEMPVVNPVRAMLLHANLVDQDVYGAYVGWDSDPWRIATAIYDVQLQLHSGASRRAEDFVAGYFQIERELPHQLTAYAREENSAKAGTSLYVLSIGPDFEVRRHLLGLRWDFWRHQAITLELARGRVYSRDQSEYRLQWSAAVP